MTMRDNENAFRSWLVTDRRPTEASARSYVSCLRRVERDLGLTLDPSVRTGAGLQIAIDRIEKVVPSKKSQGNLQTATRAYAEFLHHLT